MKFPEINPKWSLYMGIWLLLLCAVLFYSGDYWIAILDLLLGVVNIFIWKVTK